MLPALVELLVEVATCLTGYLVMFVFSLGRVRPTEANNVLVTIIGITFWVIVIGLLCLWNR